MYTRVREIAAHYSIRRLAFRMLAGRLDPEVVLLGGSAALSDPGLGGDIFPPG